MNEQLVADLKETRRQLEVRGRCAGNLLNTDGKVCLDGAVGVACIENYQGGYGELDNDERSNTVIKALSDQLAGRVIKNPMGNGQEIEIHLNCESVPLERVFVFNDLAATTDQDCFDLIDKALAQEGGLA